MAALIKFSAPLFATASRPALEAHPAFYAIGTGGSYPGGKAVGPWSWPLSSI